VNVRGVLLGRARALRNSIFGRGRSRARRGARGPFADALFAVGAGLILYLVIDGFFDELVRAGATRAEMQAVLALVFDVALAMLVIFDLESAVSTLILDRDLDLLRAAPLAPRALLGLKLLDGLPRTAAPIGVVALPALLAWAVPGPTPAAAWIVAPVVLALLWAIPLGAGTALSLAFLSRIPARRARESLGLGSLLVFAALWVFNFVVLPRFASQAGEPLARVRGLLAAAGHIVAMTPGGWAADLIAADAPGSRVRSALALIAAAAASLALAAFAGGRLLAPLLVAARTPVAGAGRRGRRLRVAVRPFLPAVMRRDWLLFTRDWILLGDVIAGVVLWALLPLIVLPLHPLRSPELVRAMLLALAVGTGWGIGTRAFPVERRAAAWMRIGPVPAGAWVGARFASVGAMTLAPVAVAALGLGLAARLGAADWAATLASVLPAAALSVAVGLWIGAKFGEPGWTSPASVLTLSGRLTSAAALVLQTAGWIALPALARGMTSWAWLSTGLAATVALGLTLFVLSALARRVAGLGYHH
jgi:hypothetical protein